eukprot:sb/3464344/
MNPQSSNSFNRGPVINRGPVNRGPVNREDGPEEGAEGLSLGEFMSDRKSVTELELEGSVINDTEELRKDLVYREPTYEDVLSVHGTKEILVPDWLMTSHKFPFSSPLYCRAPEEREPDERPFSIHHFCTMSVQPQLPRVLHNITRRAHTQALEVTLQDVRVEHWPDPILASLKLGSRENCELWSEHWPDRTLYKLAKKDLIAAIRQPNLLDVMIHSRRIQQTALRPMKIQTLLKLMKMIEPLEEGEVFGGIERDPPDKYIESVTGDYIHYNKTRRGALYVMLGMFKEARADLDSAIEAMPKLADAYWHRHLIHVTQGELGTALNDLTNIIRHNQNQPRVYLARAEIYHRQGDITGAILNYSQALKRDPENAETFYKRAALFEEKGDILLALEDYTVANRLCPSNTVAILKKGTYNFERGSRDWLSANQGPEFPDLVDQTKLSKAKRYLDPDQTKLKNLSKAKRYLQLNINLRI